MRKLTASVAMIAAGGLLLAACGGSSDDGGGGEEDSGPVSLRIDEIGGGSTLPEDDPIKPELDKELNIDLTVNAATDPAEFYNQLSTALAAGDTADLFQVDRAHLAQFVSQGLVLDISDHLDKNLETYKEFLDPETLKTATIDDKLYGISKRSPGFVGTTYWIRQDWLDTLNLEMPANVDDFADVLKAFTEQDPDGNGKDDTYGLTGGTTGTHLNNTAWTGLWASFDTGGPMSFYEKDGQLINGLDDPNTQEALEYFNELVEAGALDPDYATNQNLREHERAMQGKAGVVSIDWPRMTKPEFVDQYKKAQPDADWVQVGPLEGPGGEGGARYDAFAVPMYAIPASLEGDDAKLEKIFDLLNYVSTDEGNRMVAYGIEDTHFKLAGDEVTMTKKGIAESEPFWLYQFTGRDEAPYLSTKFANAESEIKFAMDQPTFVVYDALVTPPEGSNSTDASTFAAEQIAQFVSGKKSFDEWDGFVDQLKNQFGYQANIDAGIEELEGLDVLSD